MAERSKIIHKHNTNNHTYIPDVGTTKGAHDYR